MNSYMCGIIMIDIFTKNLLFVIKIECLLFKLDIIDYFRPFIIFLKFN